MKEEMNNAVFPWQLKQWQHLQSCKHCHRLPHALLLTGIQDIGKYHFAKLFGAALLCEKPSSDGFPCLKCHACHLQVSGHHPDVVMIDPESIIKIDQIRALTEKVQQTSQQGGYFVAIINKAERMNNAAANALLKTLEEPRENVLLLLITSSPSKLLATINSRCQKINFSISSDKIIKDWLKSIVDHKKLELLWLLADGAPMRVLEYNNKEFFTFFEDWIQKLLALITHCADPLSLALLGYREHTNQIIQLLLTSMVLAVRCKMTNSSMQNDSLLTGFIEKLMQQYSIKQLFKFIDLLTASKQQLNGAVKINTQLLLENVLIEMYKSADKKGSKHAC